MISNISNRIFIEISNDISSHLLINNTGSGRYYVVKDSSLDKINSMLHKIPQFSLICGHQVIAKIQKLNIVKDVNYDLVKNNHIWSFFHLEIIFK
jgi:hypothetical protein